MARRDLSVLAMLPRCVGWNKRKSSSSSSSYKPLQSRYQASLHLRRRYSSFFFLVHLLVEDSIWAVALVGRLMVEARLECFKM